MELPMMDEQRYRVGIDIGGTFTDIVISGSNGTFYTKKTPSTPTDYSRGIITGLFDTLREHDISPSQIDDVVHATTVATNAILENKGAKTGLITTAGFRDVLEFRRIRIPVMYDLNWEKPKALVPRRLRVEVSERLGPDGSVWRPLNDESVRQAAEHLLRAEVESVAICLLHSYASPAHELRVAELVRNILPSSTYITCSHQIMSQAREYERTSTTVVNAMLGPIISQYLDDLNTNLARNGVIRPIQVMQSGGGQMSVAAAREKPAYIIESGPAAGVIAAATIARKQKLDRVITLDMGGTTAKLALILDGQPEKTEDYEVGAGINLSSKLVTGAGYSVKLPFIDIAEIGAGGGSIAWFDKGGALQVGPQSAASHPGPVCYDLGGLQTTFTDATLVLGYLSPDSLAGGALKLNPEKARSAIRTQLCGQLKNTELEAAHSVYRIAVSNMIRAVKTVSTYRGHDPRECTLIAFGGNGPIVALAIAEDMGIKRVIVPPNSGLLSASGLLWADPEREVARAFQGALTKLTTASIEAELSALVDDVAAMLLEDGYTLNTISFQRQLDMRYSGQAFELSVSVNNTIPDTTNLETAFHRRYQQAYGHSLDSHPVELVNIRVIASVQRLPGSEYHSFTACHTKMTEVRAYERDVYFGPHFGSLSTPVITRNNLDGTSQKGPLIIEEYDATCVIPPNCVVQLDDADNVIIDRAS